MFILQEELITFVFCKLILLPVGTVKMEYAGVGVNFLRKAQKKKK